jgi:hypothetical protein
MTELVQISPLSFSIADSKSALPVFLGVQFHPGASGYGLDFVLSEGVPGPATVE